MHAVFIVCMQLLLLGLHAEATYLMNVCTYCIYVISYLAGACSCSRPLSPFAREDLYAGFLNCMRALKPPVYARGAATFRLGYSCFSSAMGACVRYAAAGGPLGPRELCIRLFVVAEGPPLFFSRTRGPPCHSSVY